MLNNSDPGKAIISEIDGTSATSIISLSTPTAIPAEAGKPVLKLLENLHQWDNLSCLELLRRVFYLKSFSLLFVIGQFRKQFPSSIPATNTSNLCKTRIFLASSG